MTGPKKPLTLVMASANPDKVAEIEALLAAELGAGVTILSRPAELPDVVEDGETLEDNARLKAVAIADATNMGAIADDTGLEVDALGGAPGVYSARYSGEGATYESNCAKMLHELTGVAPPDRTARFRTVAMVRWPDGTELVVDGTAEGHIAESRTGEGGFGYDAIFIPTGGDGRSFAQMEQQEKAAISHRGRAFRALASALRARPLPVS